jgi:hypothetical protein
MTMIEGLLPSAEQIARAKALRRASVAIATHAEPGRTRADVLDKLALLIADLEGMPTRECRSCGSPFGVGRDEMKLYRSHGLALPTHCRACRNRRRQERAGRTPGPATGKVKAS